MFFLIDSNCFCIIVSRRKDLVFGTFGLCYKHQERTVIYTRKSNAVLYLTFWGSFSSWGNNVETWNMISMPLQCVQTECKPVKSCTVSRPPLYLSNPESALVQITIKIISVWMLVLIAPPYFKYKIACLQFLKFSLHSLFYTVCRAVERYDISGGH